MYKPGKLGPWMIRSSERAYSNPWISVDHHDVTHPDGSPGLYGVVRYANIAIGVLPVFEDGTVPLVGQHRFPSDTYSWELPEGGGPLAQDPLLSAQWELAEETGYRARHWHELIGFDVSNSVSDERSICFLAWDLEPGEAMPDPSEQLDHRRVPFSDLLTLCLNGEIRDSLTLIMALTADARARRGELPDPVRERLLGSGA